jgi:hypothetical protein
MRYGASHPVAKDTDGAAYDTPHWQDANDDGDAADPGERRISAAYTRATKVQIERVFVDCDTKPMPGAVLKGGAPDMQEFVGPWCTDPTAAYDELVGCDIEASVALPNEVRKYEPYAIDWEVSFGDDYFVSVGTTDTWLYVTLNDPTASYPAFESVYDISCKAADGQSGNWGVVSETWREFTDRVVRRKSRDGFNNPDGIQMGYWVGTTTCQNIVDMLKDPAGDGSCIAWAQLLRACWEIQGVTGGTVYQLVPAAYDGMLVKDWQKCDPCLCLGGSGVNETMSHPADRTVIPFSQGYPYWYCVEPVPDGTLETLPGGDDGFGPTGIHTGADGVCDSIAVATDV